MERLNRYLVQQDSKKLFKLLLDAVTLSYKASAIILHLVLANQPAASYAPKKGAGILWWNSQGLLGHKLYKNFLLPITWITGSATARWDFWQIKVSELINLHLSCIL